MTNLSMYYDELYAQVSQSHDISFDRQVYRIWGDGAITLQVHGQPLWQRSPHLSPPVNPPIYIRMSVIEGNTSYSCVTAAAAVRIRKIMETIADAMDNDIDNITDVISALGVDKNEDRMV